jgi:predicted enzyme related to lactoylglutathione lyase
MPSRLRALAFDAADPVLPAQFWGAVLDRPVVEEPDGLLLPGDETQTGLRFVASDSAKVGLNSVHLHLTSGTPTAQAETVAAALALGASHLDLGQLPEEGHIVLADPGGNEFCVIEAGNRFLAGCGFLGELAGDGGREVGLFWSAALGWSLVWDQDEETSIQSPQGGTKVSWGGPPEAPRTTPNRQRLELVTVADDLRDEVARLVSCGATVLGDADGPVVVLADPGDNELTLSVG